MRNRHAHILALFFGPGRPLGLDIPSEFRLIPALAPPGPAFRFESSPFVASLVGAGVDGDSERLSAGVPFVCGSSLAGRLGVEAESDGGFNLDPFLDKGLGAHLASNEGCSLSMTIFLGSDFFSVFMFGVDMVRVSVEVDIFGAGVGCDVLEICQMPSRGRSTD